METSKVFIGIFVSIRYWFESQNLRNVINVVDKSDDANFFIKKSGPCDVFCFIMVHKQQNFI